MITDENYNAAKTKAVTQTKQIMQYSYNNILLKHYTIIKIQEFHFLCSL